MAQRPRAAPERPNTFSGALDRAALALQAGRLDEAERLAAGVLKSDRGSLAAARLLGQALLMQGRATEAIEPLGRAARRSGDPAIETLLARAFTDSGRAEEALDQLRQATTRTPPYPLAFVELGDLLGKLGRFDDAQAVFEQGLALAPEAPILRMGLGHLQLRRNDRPAARALFQEVRTAAPERYDARVALADVLVLDGDYADAAELYRGALTLRPADDAVRISLGKCLLEMGERLAGEAALRAAAHGAAQMAGPAIAALAATSHGRFFLRPSDAARFLKVAT